MLILGTVFDIKKYSIHDGPGIRTTVFFKGCPLRCWWCHNPESQDPEPQESIGTGRKREFTTQCGDGKELIGKKVSIEEIAQEILKDRIFYDQSGGGLTISGGEPLMQPEFLISILSWCKGEDIHTAVDTSGYASPQVLKKVSSYTDLFLYDIKLIDRQKHMLYTGVDVEPILNNLKMLDREKKEIIIRFPVIPQITDTRENITDIIKFIKNLNNIRKISLLPFNHLGDEKYRRLKMKNKMKQVPVPSDEKINEIKENFEAEGYSVKIGG